MNSLLLAALLCSVAEDAPMPIVIAHRGASGHRPEHTLASYELAIAMGADYVEPDLVMTRDGVLVCRHEHAIGDTTDVADHPEFADRGTTKEIDGRTVTGWFVEDFTLDELKTLRATERLPELRRENASYDGRFEVPTLQEVIDLVRRKEAETGRTIGLYPETKSPSYFDAIGLSIEEPLVRLLKENGYEGADAPVFLQSFEVGNLVELNGMTDLRLIQLLGGGGARPIEVDLGEHVKTYADLTTPAGLDAIASYADGIGPSLSLVVPRDAEGRLGTPTSLIADAHARGLLVHAWTVRNEDVFLAADHKGDPLAEHRYYYGLGLDGLFSDFPDTARAALSR